MRNKDITKIAITVAFMCAVAPLTIPLVPVPVTMATFVLWTVAMTLPTKEALIATALFVLIGAMGAPVFSNFTGGLGIILGPRGGYILAFLTTPLFFKLTNKIFNNKILIRSFGVFSSITFICLFGILWMILQSSELTFSKDITRLLVVGYIVFIPSTIIKGVMAYIVADRIKPWI